MKLLINAFIVLLSIWMQPSPRVPEGVKEAFRTGSAKSLAQYMEDKVALTLPDDDDIYVRSEVQKKLSTFFYANKPSSFVIQFEGGKDANQYAIGVLKTNNGDYRVSLLLRSNKISQLRIEKEE
ncbi:MAG TPA: DUF4783 domain-containing protein [Bacteroidales bacterium]|nr:DUF4783 domain-containing protein [Bacteroidales bacterium]HPO65232.1 DUF4783 domain-containing protein [Bacteroidales bacterium]